MEPHSCSRISIERRASGAASAGRPAARASRASTWSRQAVSMACWLSLGRRVASLAMAFTSTGGPDQGLVVLELLARGGLDHRLVVLKLSARRGLDHGLVVISGHQRARLDHGLVVVQDDAIVVE